MDYCPKCIKIWEEKHRICPFCGYENDDYQGSVFDILDDMAALRNEDNEDDIFSYNAYSIAEEDIYDICQNDVIENIKEAERYRERLRDKNKNDVYPQKIVRNPMQYRRRGSRPANTVTYSNKKESAEKTRKEKALGKTGRNNDIFRKFLFVFFMIVFFAPMVISVFLRFVYVFFEFVFSILS